MIFINLTIFKKVQHFCEAANIGPRADRPRMIDVVLYLAFFILPFIDDTTFFNWRIISMAALNINRVSYI